MNKGDACKAELFYFILARKMMGQAHCAQCLLRGLQRMKRRYRRMMVRPINMLFA